jgi:hypothetical protein
LSAKIFGKFSLHGKCCFVVDQLFIFAKAVDRPQLIFRCALHPYQQAALPFAVTCPRFDFGIDCAPTPQVEVANTEVGAIGNTEIIT